MNLPPSFVENMQELLGDDWDAFENALIQPSPVSVRLNPHKMNAKQLNTTVTQPVGWSQWGHYLQERPSFTFDPLFQAGVYYVQEASSMFIEQAFHQWVDGAVSVLDLCAAPGGKSTHIASLITPDSVLVSNEVIASRANILLDNVMKSGFENVVVTNSDPSSFGRLDGLFDVVVVDAPCSGEGMFRKDEASIEEWSLANVQLCSERQRRILSDVWPSLKEDGMLIYSTCTYNVKEDEENVRWIMESLGAEIVELEILPEWQITSSLDKNNSNLPVFRFLPHRTSGEGFFMAILRKRSAANEPDKKKKDKKQRGKPVVVPPVLKQVLRKPEAYSFNEINGKWRAYPSHLFNFLDYLTGVRVLNAGVLLGEMKGKDFIPAHALALSNQIDRAAFPSVDINLETALAFLRKESFLLEDEPKGILLLTYQNTPLGFVKNLGNRVNNLLPNEWRIRSVSTPPNRMLWLK
ncbi:MAG: RsmB/NOP family class I SAM-dependent RNA methyltransferase [Dysgonamonadaceae bacterium]